MRRFLWAIPVAFFLNPTFACGPAEPQYEYGAAEMRAAVEGNWSFTIMPVGAQGPLKVTVKVEQADTAPGPQARAPSRTFIRAAYACGSRTLLRSAAACIDVSQMPLKVTFVSGDTSFSTMRLLGMFNVYGTQFGPLNSDLTLTLGDYEIHAQVGPDRSVHNAGVGPGSSGGATATLTIVARS